MNNVDCVSRLIASSIKGFRTKALLNPCSLSLPSLEQLVHQIYEGHVLDHAIPVLDRETERRIYRNLKYIQERTPELIAIEKENLQKIENSFPIALRKQFVEVREQHLEKMMKTCAELDDLMQGYFARFHFSDDYLDLSIDARRPKRKLFVNFASDIFSAARYYVKEHSTVNLADFTKLIDELEQETEQHPSLGNNDLDEELPRDFRGWEKAQLQARETLLKMVERLKLLLATTLDIPLEIAAAELQKARIVVFNDKDRWAKPIIGCIEISPGPLPSQRGKVDHISFEHRLVCLNLGFASSCSRNREPTPDCIQSNFHRVTLIPTPANYTTSAINVEFSQADVQKRALATELQTAEILRCKAQHRWSRLSAEQRSVLGTKDKPLLVETTTVNMMSMNTIHEWIADNPDVNKLLAKYGANVPEPNREHRLSRESHRAWLSFDRDSGGAHFHNDRFQIKDEEGRIQTILIDRTGEKTTYLIPIEGGNEYIHVQFDIACYNVGVNKDAYRMALGEEAGVAAILTTDDDIPIGSPILEWNPWLTELLHTPMIQYTPYDGRSGFELQDEMNAAAFAKHKRRYQERLQFIAAEKESCQVDPSFSKVVNQKIACIHRLRAQFLLLERFYAIVPSVGIKSLGKMLFYKWQKEREALAKALDFSIHHPRITPSLKKHLTLVCYEEDLGDLYNEISDQLEFRDHRKKKYMDQNMYAFPAALMTFSCLLEEDPHGGCRSGKDRTSLKRMEIATRMLLRATQGRFFSYREQEEFPATIEIREQVLLNSGQIDGLAYKNIGSSGLNQGDAHRTYIKEFGRESDYETTVMGGAYKSFIMFLK